MNNNEEITPNKDQEQKTDTPENNGTEPNLENNLEKVVTEQNDLEIFKLQFSKDSGSSDKRKEWLGIEG